MKINIKRKGGKDPAITAANVMTYIRMVEDLERIASSATPEPRLLDPRLASEIKELKAELEKQGYVYFDGYKRPFRLVPVSKKHDVQRLA
jgi:hypothetical protein